MLILSLFCGILFSKSSWCERRFQKSAPACEKCNKVGFGSFLPLKKGIVGKRRSVGGCCSSCSIRSFLVSGSGLNGTNWKILSSSERFRIFGTLLLLHFRHFSSLFFLFSHPVCFYLLYISLFLQKSMPFHPGRIVFSCFPDCLHFNPVRIFSSLSPPFFLPASTLFLPGTRFFRFFPPAFPLPFPCAYI